jgi:peptidyl-prolyl cis-trans isomerase SurA
VGCSISLLVQLRYAVLVNRNIFVALVLLAFTTRAEMVDRIAAVVGNDIISLSEVEARIAPEVAKARGDVTKQSELLKMGLEALVGERLMEAQIKELNIEVADSEIELGMEDVKKQNNITGEQFEGMLAQEGYTLASYRAFMRKHLAKLKLVNLKVRSKVKIGDEELKAEYARLVRESKTDVEVHARHVLIQLTPKSTPEEIEAARKKVMLLAEQVKGPGVDFVEFVKQNSEGSSKVDGGDLGFFRRGTMVAEFERVAFGLPVGAISDPIRTKFGFHIIKIEEHRAIDAPAFDEVKDQLRDRLLKGQLDKYTEGYVKELRAQSVVEIKI